MSLHVSDSSPVPDPDPDRDDEAPSPEFGQALEAYERDRAPAEEAARATSALPVGTKVHGTVRSVNDDHVLVDYGGRSEGVVETRHFRGEDGQVSVKPGDELDLFVVASGDEIRLAPSVRAESQDALRQLREAHAASMPVTGRVTGVNSGGLAIDIGGVRGFCPMSQIELGYCADPSRYIGRTLEFMVTSIEEGRGSAVVSRRRLLKQAEEEAAQRLVASLKPGDEIDGTVTRLEPFGAFVNLGGVDGLVHVSEIRHGRVGHPKQALTEGQQVRVKVLRIEPGKGGVPRIGLSIKAAAPDPWVGVEERFTVGETVEGKVARLTDFGAFVTLAPGIDGLVHVSEIARERVRHPKDVLKPGQTVQAVVLGVDPAKKRVSLSIKRTLAKDEGWPEAEAPAEASAEAPARESEPRGARESHRSGRESHRGARDAHRGDRDAARGPKESKQQPQDAEPTTMAIALRKAIEEAKKREQGG